MELDKETLCHLTSPYFGPMSYPSWFGRKSN